MSELHWLAPSALLTGLLWLVHVPHRMTVLGLVRTMGNPSPSDPPLADWAQRAQAAHCNAVESLLVFATLILAAHALGLGGDFTRMSALAYFASRVVHVLTYVAGIAVLRTLAFAVGWAAQLAVALRIVGVA